MRQGEYSKAMGRTLGGGGSKRAALSRWARSGFDGRTRRVRFLCLFGRPVFALYESERVGRA